MNHKFVPNKEQQCTVLVLLLLSSLIPCSAVALGVMIKSKPGDAAAFVKGFLMARGCTMFTVDFAKNYVGYLRPYFYQECGFDEITGRCSHDQPDAHKSFPSGHASTSFCTMFFTALYLLGKVNAASKWLSLRVCGGIDFTNVTIILSLSPLAVAGWVSTSRIRENDHHPSDVVGGAMIGSAWAIFWYYRYYPSIWAEDSDAPRGRVQGVLLPQ
eukprot:TRINITY_DN107565_c0_g1_i1.p1 TRINITY_DN107565_c0_g1~~TRINITY_DN107565_c0_g1_i1.p1  ORF type:complete len:223 (+),score=11.72 TRINITY_DN107565_c0_g1_i1:30-671(+)